MADIKYNPEKIIKTLKDVENKTNNKLYKKANNPKSVKEQGDPVGNIIKTGVTSFLSKNKNVSIGDFMNKKSRDKTIEKLKNTGKSSLLDTGQNVINHFRSEDIARFDKLVKAIKGSKVDKEKQANLLKIAGKVRGIKEAKKFSDLSTQRKPGEKKKPKKKREGYIFDKSQPPSKKVTKESRVMNTSSIEKSGPTITVKATEVKDKKEEEKKKNGAIVKSKGSSLANRGTKNTEVKKERDPKPYSTKNTKDKKKGIKGPSKKTRERVRDIASGAGKLAQSAVGNFASAYGDSSFNKEEVSRRHKPSAITKKKKLEKALNTLELKKKKLQSEGAALAIPAIKYGLPAAATAIGAIGTMMQIKGTQGNLFPKGSPENPYSTNKRAESSRNKRISNKAQKSAEDKWRDDNNLGGTNVEPPWKGK